jgi:hypothetical protein
MPAEETSSVVTGTSEVAPARLGVEDLDGGRLLTSAALIGAGVLIEPELLGGALLGAGVVYGLPLLGRLLVPVVTTAVQLGYSAVAGAGDLLVSARDQVGDIVATARSGHQKSRGSVIVPEP